MRNFLACIGSIAVFEVINYLLYKLFMVVVETDFIIGIINIHWIIGVLVILFLIGIVCTTSARIGCMIAIIGTNAKAYPLRVYSAFIIITYGSGIYLMIKAGNPWFFTVPIVLMYAGYILWAVGMFINAKDLADN